MPDFQEVYDLYFKDVYKYALSLSRDADIAEENYPVAPPEMEKEHLIRCVFR